MNVFEFFRNFMKFLEFCRILHFCQLQPMSILSISTPGGTYELLLLFFLLALMFSPLHSRDRGVSICHRAVLETSLPVDAAMAWLGGRNN